MRRARPANIAASCGARAAAAAPFDELAEGFVRAAYAREEPATADFEAAARAFAAFEPAVTR